MVHKTHRRMINVSSALLACALAVLAVLNPTGHSFSAHASTSADARPTGITYRKGLAKPSTNGILYHGGPLLLGTPNVYYIWYGNWVNNGSSNSKAQKILTDFISNLGGSPYYNINTTYYDSSGRHVSNALRYRKSATDRYSRGSSITGDDVQAIVAEAITPPSPLPTDTNAVYVVLTSYDVNVDGFLTTFCGWHTYATINGADIKYAFVGDPARGLDACAAQSVSPNGNASADAMASTIAHETEEAVTDPHFDAWYDKKGLENADKCAWTFGNQYTSGGGLANMNLGGHDYLIQQNWVNASGGFCAVSY
jgi:hypothetical protein